MRFTTRVSYDSTGSSGSAVRKSSPPFLIVPSLHWSGRSSIPQYDIVGYCLPHVPEHLYLIACEWAMIAACWKHTGRTGQVNRHAPALSFKTQKEEEEEEAEVVRSKIGLVFSQGPLADTKSVFVCLPGCHIKEFLCVGGSDRVYLTLQLLLCSKCPTVNAGHESHLALDRGSLFSGERGSCLEKIFNGGECGGVSVRGGAAWPVHSAVYAHIVGLCP